MSEYFSINAPMGRDEQYIIYPYSNLARIMHKKISNNIKEGVINKGDEDFVDIIRYACWNNETKSIDIYTTKEMYEYYFYAGVEPQHFEAAIHMNHPELSDIKNRLLQMKLLGKTQE